MLKKGGRGGCVRPTLIHETKPKRVKQIAGRCRTPNKILSETVIYDLANFEDDYVLPTKELLIKDANVQLDSLKCIEKHYSKSPTLKRIQNVIVNQMIEALEDQKYGFIKKDEKTDTVDISYLKIDAYLESSTNQYELYRENDQLNIKLKSQNHTVTNEFKKSNTLVPKIDVNKTDRNIKFKEVITMLRLHPKDEDLQMLLKGSQLDNLQKKVVENYRKLYSYIDSDNLIDNIEKMKVDHDDRALNNLFVSANFSILPTDHQFKSRLFTFFPIGTKLTGEEIFSKVTICLADCNIPIEIDTKVKALKLLKLYLVVSRKSTTDGTYKVKSENPYRLQIKKQTQNVVDMNQNQFTPFIIF